MRPLLCSLLLLPAMAHAQTRSAIVVDSSTFAFEDLLGGDEDHDDWVFDYNVRCVIDDATEDLVSEEIRFVPRAAGASLTNQFVLGLPDVPQSVSLSDDGGATSTLLCDGDCAAEVVLYGDVDDGFTPRGTGYVNTQGAVAFAGKAHVVTIAWPAGTPAATSGGFLTCAVPDFAIDRADLASPIDAGTTAPGNGQPLAGNFPHFCPPPATTCLPEERLPWAAPLEQVGIAEAGAYGTRFLSWLTDRTDATPCAPGTCADEDWYMHPGADVVDAVGLAAIAPLEPAPTCDDGVQNSDETGIDCGGTVCGACLPMRLNVDWNGDVVGSAHQPSLSADGTRVAFSTGYNIPALVPGHFNLWGDVYVRDVAAGETVLVSVAADGGAADFGSAWASISADGRHVAWQSGASNLVAGDTNGKIDIFVRDLQTATTEIVSVSTSGVLGDGDSERPSISGDGRYVVFSSRATNLAGTDANGIADDIFRHDRTTGETVRVNVSSAGTQGDTGYRTRPVISPDGRYVAFDSNATNLVPGDTNGFIDVFRRDMVDGTTVRVSLADNEAQATSQCVDVTMSADGTRFAFRSNSALAPGAGGSTYHVFLRDLTEGTTTIVSVATSGALGDGDSQRPSMSADGRHVAFESRATSLGTPTAPGFQSNIFVRDTVAGTTSRISVSHDGTPTVPDGWSGGHAMYPSVAPDGSAVGFNATLSNLVPGDTNNVDDVFLVFLP